MTSLQTAVVVGLNWLALSCACMQVALALQIVRFSEMLEDMLGDLLPNRITDYAYVLSDLFSNFYTECKARAATNPLTLRTYFPQFSPKRDALYLACLQMLEHSRCRTLIRECCALHPISLTLKHWRGALTGVAQILMRSRQGLPIQLCLPHMCMQVVGSEQEASRLLLCEATAVVMRQCFSLLGIKPLYRI